jgi:hypothetical protein
MVNAHLTLTFIIGQGAGRFLFGQFKEVNITIMNNKKQVTFQLADLQD